MPLTRLNEFTNSAIECGKLLNIILKGLVNPKLKTNNIIQRYKTYIIKVCKSHFDYLCKILITLKNNKIVEVQPENYEITSPIARLMLIESLHLMCKATIGDKSCLVNEINATLWHVLVLYFFSNRLYYEIFFFNLIILFRVNDIYQQLFLNILEIAINFGTEETLFNILFKINLLGSLYNAYETFVKNEVADRTLNIDSFLIYLKKIVAMINSINKVK